MEFRGSPYAPTNPEACSNLRIASDHGVPGLKFPNKVVGEGAVKMTAAAFRHSLYEGFISTDVPIGSVGDGF
ncbi:hypothetical protein QQS21_007558, partial [Conoideocrella luteorostrata]